MFYREFAPSPPLAPFVRCYWTLHAGREASGARNRVFPDGSMEIVFHLAEPFSRVHDDGSVVRQNPLLLAGQIWKPLELACGGAADCFGVRFHPGGAYPFLRFPQQEAAGLILDLESVWGSRARRLRERLGDQQDDVARVQIVEDFLLAAGPNPPAPRAALSPRQFRRRFEAEVGIPPKLFERIRRFQRALAAIGRMPMAQAAASCGYFDQSHMVRDFREFAGATPSEVARERGDVLFVQDGEAKGRVGSRV